MTRTNPTLARKKRHTRVRVKVGGTPAQPRLNVFRSLNHVYAQIIDDAAGKTLAAAGTLEDAINKGEKKTKTDKARLVGKMLAERAIDKGIRQVVFDRGGYQYHGRIKAIADAAREAGLKF